jgi:mannose-6-phosphate isomerase-like protein (cupin superfamily)
MFAVPEFTVYPAASAPAAAPSLTALLRVVTTLPGPIAGPVPVDDPRVRVWISVLRPGQHAAATYDARQGAFAVLDGPVVERSGGPPRPLAPGQVRAFGPGYHHEVRNPGPHPVHTLHIQIHP